MTTWCGMRGSSRRSGTALRGILCGQGWCGKPASTDGRALGRSGADPLAGFAGDINGTLMMRMQVRFRQALWRNRDRMHTQPLRSGCLGGHTRKIVEVLLPGVGFPSLNHHANWFGAGLHVASLRPSLARYGTVGTARRFRCHYSDLRVPSRRKYLPAMNAIGNSLRQPK